MTDRDAHLQLILNARDGYSSDEAYWIGFDQYTRILDILLEDRSDGVIRGPSFDISDEIFDIAAETGRAFFELKADGSVKVYQPKDILK